MTIAVQVVVIALPLPSETAHIRNSWSSIAVQVEAILVLVVILVLPVVVVEAVAEVVVEVVVEVVKAAAVIILPLLSG